MQVQAIIRAHDARGSIISESAYPAIEMAKIPSLITAMKARIEASGRQCEEVSFECREARMYSTIRILQTLFA